MNEPWESFSPYWLQTAAPSGANGGLLESLTRPAEPWNDPQPTIFIQTPWGSMTPPPSLFGLSPTFPPAPPPSSWESSSASLWHTPFSEYARFPAPPAQPVHEPWNDPRSAILAQTPWVPMTPAPPFVPPSAFLPALPLQHLASGKYWPAAPAPSDENEQPPAHGFYFSPVPQAPSWDSVPTHPVDSAAQSFSQRPSPASWATPAPPPLEYLDSGKYWPAAPAPSGANVQPPAHGFYFPPVPQAPSWDQVPTHPAGGAAPSHLPPPSTASWATAAPPLKHLDSGKYWPAATAWGGGESATAVPQPSPVTAAGLTKQASVGLAKGLIGLPGMFGDARDLGFNIGDWISQKILDRRTLTDQQRLEQAHAADFTPGAAARQKQQRLDEARRNLFVTNPFLALAPSSADIQGVVEHVTGPFRKPENVAEEYIDTAGRSVPALFGGPGGWARRGAQWLAPTLTSETAGQLTKGTEWEPAARLAGAIFGGAAPYFARPSAPRAAPPPAPLVAERPPIAALPAPETLLALPAPRPGTQQAWVGPIFSRPAPAEGMTAYRVWGGGSERARSWLTPTPPASSSAAIRDLALPPTNTAQYISPVTIPPGTQYQFGTAARAFGQPGGGSQIQLLKHLPDENFGPGTPLPP